MGLVFLQISFANWTNTFYNLEKHIWNLEKYILKIEEEENILQFVQKHLAIWTNTIWAGPKEAKTGGGDS